MKLGCTSGSWARMYSGIRSSRVKTGPSSIARARISVRPGPAGSAIS
jgi:hypothetical protein